MANFKLHGKDLKEYVDVDIDELFSQLTEEQIAQLGDELIDIDDPMVPPSERCAYKTDKEPSGSYDRKKLLDFLEKKAREEKDWDEAKPFSKEVRGKIWKPKKEEKIQINEDAEVETEWDEVLKQATEEELVDLAAILGFHGMLNQVQYHDAFVEKKEMGETSSGSGAVSGFSGLAGVAKPQNLKVFDPQLTNTTDVDEALEKVKANDKELKELNLNNIKNISLEKMREVAEALKENTTLQKLHMANTRCTDRVAKVFVESLKENNTLTVLNLESNYISGNLIVDLLEAIAINKTLSELRIANQRPSTLGHKVELKIAAAVQKNEKLMKLGIFLDVPVARIRVQEAIQANNDAVRKDRAGQSSEDQD